VIPLVIGTVIYIFVPPGSHLSIVKLAAIGFQFLVFGLLSLRLKGQTIADRLLVLLRYSLRPHLYVFTKNDLETRDVICVKKEKKPSKTKRSAKSIKKDNPSRSEKAGSLSGIPLSDTSQVVRLELGKKGGINVSYSAEKE
jgi:hypothetical protein